MDEQQNVGKSKQTSYWQIGNLLPGAILRICTVWYSSYVLNGNDFICEAFMQGTIYVA